jgi:hypothetical protein
MPAYVFGAIFLFTIATRGLAATVYQVSNAADADVVVSMVDSAEKADLLVVRVSSPGLAWGDAAWYITQNPDEASVRVYFGAADAGQVKIFFVNQTGAAGWVRPHPFRGRF